MANIVILTGRVTKDLELRYTTGEEPKAMLKFALAVDRPVKGTGTDFITCVIWGKPAEAFAKYVTKGMKVLVNGRWQTGSFQGQKGKVFTNECNVVSWEFADSKRDNTDSVADGGADTSMPDMGFLDLNLDGGDDIPFN